MCDVIHAIQLLLSMGYEQLGTIIAAQKNMMMEDLQSTKFKYRILNGSI